MTEKGKQLLAEIDQFDRLLRAECFREHRELDIRPPRRLWQDWRELRGKLLHDVNQRIEAEEKKMKQLSRVFGSDAGARRG